jgi:hypothetical protein
MGVAEATMGHQHASEPVTKADKEMSKRHKKHRAAVAKIHDKEKQLVASNKYNLPHAREHMDQYKKNVKALVKIRKERSIR